LSERLESSLEDRQREQRLVRARAIVSALFVILGLGLVLTRLHHLQLERHDHFTVLSTENRVKVQPVPPNRGLIFDAKGVVLAENHPSFSLVITIERVEDLRPPSPHSSSSFRSRRSIWPASSASSASACVSSRFPSA
jgi:penicillin-binding protein 2